MSSKSSYLRAQRRPGVIVPLVALCLVGMLGCVALAIDLGLIATARTQSQAASDAAAMTGARTMNGDVANDNNVAAVDTAVENAATDNNIMSHPISAGMVTTKKGAYVYDEVQNKFVPAYYDGGNPKPDDENYSLVNVTIEMTDYPAAFSKIWNIQFFNIKTSATAAHRPRDVAVILDHSGSMRFDSLLGIPYTGSRTMSNNPETVYPLFGHYSATGSAALQNTASYTQISSQIYGASNVSVTTDAGAPIVEDFYQHDEGATAYIKAWAPPDVALPDDSFATLPGGDNFLPMDSDSSQYARTAQEVIGASTQAGGERSWKGYTNPPYEDYSGATVPEFSGYIRAPRYWGKTFWIWPPDPDPVKDWRVKFFGTNDNTRLYDSSGNWNSPSEGGYTVNYNAILTWIKSSPTIFPAKLRGGRILYYDEIPNAITGSFPNYGNDNQKFWKLYIDYVLGICQTSSSGNYDEITRYTGYGDDYSWGTIRITAPSSTVSDRVGRINNGPGYSAGYTGSIRTDGWNSTTPRLGYRIEIPRGSGNWYTVTTAGSTIRVDRPLDQAVTDNDEVMLSNNEMPYMDNPKRPKLHFWFGPMTMVDFLGNYNLSSNGTYDNWYDFRWPGSCHEAPLFTQKLGVRAALKDMEKNHPNDYVSMMMFSTPKYSSSGSGQFNQSRAPLGRQYQRLQDALFYPPDTIIDNESTSGGDIDVFDATTNNEVPRSEGGTTPVMGIMLAYNQFSTRSDLRSLGGTQGIVGGNGRKGAQKLVIFLTDGVANTTAYANFVNGGSHKCYYQIRNPGTPTEYPSNSGSVASQLYGVVDRLCALETAGNPGYSTTRKPVKVHSLAFGTLFEPTTSSSDKDLALSILQNVAYRGDTLGSASTPLPEENRITGTSAQRVDKLQLIFKKIMQDGQQVSLLE